MMDCGQTYFLKMVGSRTMALLSFGGTLTNLSSASIVLIMYRGAIAPFSGAGDNQSMHILNAIPLHPTTPSLPRTMIHASASRFW